MADPISLTSPHAPRRYKEPHELQWSQTGLTKQAHSAFRAAYIPFYKRQRARVEAYEAALAACAWFRQQAYNAVLPLAEAMKYGTDAEITAARIMMTALAKDYLEAVEAQYLPRLHALGLDPHEPPPENTPACALHAGQEAISALGNPAAT